MQNLDENSKKILESRLRDLQNEYEWKEMLLKGYVAYVENLDNQLHQIVAEAEEIRRRLHGKRKTRKATKTRKKVRK